jgi:hypothetical protein
MARKVFGRDPGHGLAAGPELAPAVVGQREGQGLAEIVGIGGAERFVWHGRRVAGREEQYKNNATLTLRRPPNFTDPASLQDDAGRQTRLSEPHISNAELSNRKSSVADGQATRAT